MSLPDTEGRTDEPRSPHGFGGIAVDRQLAWQNHWPRRPTQRQPTLRDIRVRACTLDAGRLERGVKGVPVCVPEKPLWLLGASTPQSAAKSGVTTKQASAKSRADLARLFHDQAFATSDSATHFQGGALGYIDYPAAERSYETVG